MVLTRAQHDDRGLQAIEFSVRLATSERRYVIECGEHLAPESQRVIDELRALLRRRGFRRGGRA